MRSGRRFRNLAGADLPRLVAVSLNIEHRYTPHLRRTVSLRDNNSDEGMWEEAFMRSLHMPPKEMPEPKVVLDLGANIGLTAADYKAWWPEAQVWMVEPHPENMALARLNAPSCIPLQCAVAVNSGYRSLREEGLTASAYSLGRDGREIYAIGLPFLVECLGGKIDFCKMDIEGAEWEILEQPLTGIKHLLVEFHGDGDILERGLELLTDTGWEARHHMPHPYAVYATR